MSTPTALVYTADILRSINMCTLRLSRQVRKTLFRFGLWRPKCAPEISSSPPVDRRTGPATSSIRLATLNVQSLTKKHVLVSDLITAHDLDVLVVTESWHVSSSDVAVRRSAPAGYSFLDQPRSDRQGGGLIIYHGNRFKAKRIELLQTPTTFEALVTSISSKHGPTILLAIYRPGSTPPPALFFNELSTLLEQFVLSNAQLILTGDLNLKLKDPTHPESETFAMITEQFGLTQHVAEPTHKLGGWLDVIVTRNDCQVTDVTVHPPILSDHGLVMASIPFIYEPSLLITRRIRHWKKLDRAAFRSALQAEPLFNDAEAFSSSTATDLFSSYETVMLKLIDSFLPQRTVRSRQHPLSPWFNADCRALRRQARRLE